jgi:electron transfer flavoprotein beta subunit
MKIVVAFKWAADPQEAIVAADGSVDFGRATLGISEYDPQAFEVGRRLADATGAELIGLTVGGPAAATPMARKAALSRGLDSLVTVTDPSLDGAAATQTGVVLAAAVARIGDVDLVLTGDSSVDLGAQLVPSVLAGVLGWPAVSQVTAVSGPSGDLRIERNQDGGTQVLLASGPVVVSIAADAVVPRIPGMKDILGAGRKPTTELAYASLAVAPLVEFAVVGRARPELKARQGKVIDGADPAAAAVELVAALRGSHVL